MENLASWHGKDRAAAPLARVHISSEILSNEIGKGMARKTEGENTCMSYAAALSCISNCVIFYNKDT